MGKQVDIYDQERFSAAGEPGLHDALYDVMTQIRQLRARASEIFSEMESADIARLAGYRITEAGTGHRPAIVLTVDYDNLAANTGHVGMELAGSLPVVAVHRVACDAQLIPTILDTNSVSLELGRTHRFSWFCCAEDTTAWSTTPIGT